MVVCCKTPVLAFGFGPRKRNMTLLLLEEVCTLASIYICSQWYQGNQTHRVEEQKGSVGCWLQLRTARQKAKMRWEAGKLTKRRSEYYLLYIMLTKGNHARQIERKEKRRLGIRARKDSERNKNIITVSLLLA